MTPEDVDYIKGLIANVRETVTSEQHLREQWIDEHVRQTAAERTNIERRLDQMNDLRAQIDKERGAYILRESFDKEHKELTNRVDALTLAISGNKSQIWFMGAIITMITSLISVSVEIIIRLAWR